MGLVVSATPWPRFTTGKGPRYPLHRKLGGPQSWSGHRGYFFSSPATRHGGVWGGKEV
jgi:hypothetical protein